MRLIELTLCNFKNFKGLHNINLFELNLFQGDNGDGKSTLILDSVLFALYGYAKGKIAQLVCKGEKSASVRLYLEHNNKTYSITREIPSKLTVLEDAVPIHGSIKVKEEFLESLFHDITWFRKFRLFDVAAGINILEESSLTLRKTLLSFNEEKLNTIREKLLALKREREIYNKKNINMFPHAPSEARVGILEKGLNKIKALLEPLQADSYAKSLEMYELNKQVGATNQTITMLSNKINSTKNLVECPTCHQEVKNEYKESVEKEVTELINTNMGEVVRIENEWVKKQQEVANIREEEEQYSRQIFRVKSRLERMKLRLQAKQYVWTDKDVELIKKSISELDNFYSFYLTETIKSLEPVINHILKKVGFILKFQLNKKGQFDFSVLINNNEFDYKELSTGQKLMVSMAFKMALLLEKGESGLIISDEGMSSLSETNLRLMFELILGFPFQILAVVHRYENPPNFLKVYDVRKGMVTRV